MKRRELMAEATMNHVARVKSQAMTFHIWVGRGRREEEEEGGGRRGREECKGACSIQ